MAVLALGVGCRGREPSAASALPSPSDAPTTTRLLTMADVRAFLAVRARALGSIEAAVAVAERSGGDVLGKVEELTAAERSSARALGVDWRRFTWVRDEIGRLLTSQRQREDQRVLGEELARSRDDLEA